MNKEDFLRALAEKYPLIIRTPYHVQISTTNGYHNIWFNKYGDVKYAPCGQSKWKFVDLENLLKELKNYSYDNSEVVFLQSLSIFLKRIEGRTGIFVDAGFFEGNGKIAIVRAMAGDYDITIRKIKCLNNVEAERLAVEKAAELYPGNEPIFTDCKTISHPRVQWIPRKSNREADCLGNMRR